jgi:hypothetical protein
MWVKVEEAKLYKFSNEKYTFKIKKRMFNFTEEAAIMTYYCIPPKCHAFT